jgi:aspartyl-tRNA(Asn)/glutamyl-tRNA(Gln) amidotransferase subunit A
MGDAPWQGDACSLVDEFRAGRRSPLDELRATYEAIDASDLNAFCHLPRDEAEAAARAADVSKPFGGVPIGVKELDEVEGWPATEACAVFADRIAPHTSVMVQRLRDVGGAVLAGQTTASEFGGVNLTRSVIHGTTHNPWQHGRTPGGSSGGSAAAVAGGLVTIATGGDGGGSIRIPAGFTGLFGLKATFGRIPRAPRVQVGNYTSVVGCMARSVRDTARWFDVCNGHDARDMFSLPRVDGWERNLGSFLPDLRGARVAVVADWGGAVVSPTMWEVLAEAADHLIALAGLRRVDLDTELPSMGAAWGISGTIAVHAALADAWPGCADILTPEMRFSLERAPARYGLEARAKIEERRMELNERMAAIFDPVDGVDFVITASNPDVAFDADGPLPREFGGVHGGTGNNGRLTFPANLHGSAAVSIPSGFVDTPGGPLPVGLQVVGRHFDEQRLLDLSLAMERSRPWPLTTAAAATSQVK